MNAGTSRYRALVLYLLTLALMAFWSTVATGVAYFVSWPTDHPGLFFVGIILGGITSWRFLPWHKLDPW